MKYYFLLFTIAFLSCNKNNHADSLPVGELIINDAQLNGTKTFAVGQVLKIAPSIAKSRSDLDFSWTLSPKEGEQVTIDNSEISWRPGKSQQYKLALNVQSNAGEQGLKEYTFEILPADIRYYLWGASRADVEYSESASFSDEVDGDEPYVQYLVHHTATEYDTKNAVLPGEYVTYFFENDRLARADVYVVIQNQVDPKVYYDTYLAKQSRLSSYHHLGNENKWLETSAEAMSYKNTPERWGEAFSKGYVTMSDRYENERTNVTVEMMGGDDGVALLVMRYAHKE